MNRIPALLLCLPFALLCLSLKGDEVTLDPETPLIIYLEADMDSAILTTLSPAEDDWTLQPGIPLEDDQWDAGWRALEFTHPTLVWALAENLTKDLELRPETPLFAEPEASVNNMLTILENPEDGRVLREENGWARVRVTTKLVGFAQRAEWAAKPEPVSALAESRERPQEDTPTEVDDDLFAAAETLDISSSEPSPPPRAAQPRRTLQTVDGETIEGTMRFYEGFLGQNRSFLGRSPEYPYSLTNQRGRRLADLDTSNLLLTTSLKKQVGRQIAVQGILQDDDRRVPVIVIESLHLP
ncbi:MAG: hypothetical protein LAT55_01365 [Opitutales bacterium]|nr:hypothetical protein [Opitutales bacterium]